MTRFLASAVSIGDAEAGVSDLFILNLLQFDPELLGTTRGGALLNPFFDLFFEPGRCHLPDPPALWEAAFSHHAPDCRSSEWDPLSQFLESQISHFTRSPYRFGPLGQRPRLKEAERCFTQR